MSLRRTRTLSVCIALAVPLAAAAAPPSGRYRCYLPPGYQVTGWFDLRDDGRYLFQGGEPARYRYDADTGRLTWIDGELAAEYPGGRYYSPSGDAPTGRRHAIVLEHRDAGGARSECFLTTH
ncbi:MAG: hypothetical protein KDH15_02425 [Rhodocyclaceae bacterium]|nr:hypothetical protein [Rhodocyclaceae bacterium]